MSEYQKVFLSYVFIYYFVKVGIFIAYYLVAKLVVKGARQRQEQDRISFMKKRADEQERWKVAYGAYYRQKKFQQVNP
jgi:signal transduction histidine kinase